MLHIPSSGINIPRNQLPQIKSTDVHNFLAFLRKNHVQITQENAIVSHLHPSQVDFNHEKVGQMMDAPASLKKLIIVSSDNIILDGHHRWLALLNISKHETIPIYRVHIPFLGLLGLAKRYPKVTYKQVVEEKSLLDEQFEQLLNEGVHDAGIFKVVFLSGGSGSGKDFVMRQTLDGHGLTEINADKAFEYMLDKHKLDKRMPADEEAQRNAIRGRAKSITELKQRLAIQGRNGLIINGTGAEFEKTKRLKEMLEEMGYESKMLFVNTSNEISRKRNKLRGERGGREVPEKVRQTKWEEAQMTKAKYEQLFGKEHYHEFDNSEDLTGDQPGRGTPRDIMTRHVEKYNELMKIFKQVRAFTQAPPKHEVAQAWIQKEKGALERNKVQELKPNHPVHQMQAPAGQKAAPKAAAPVAQKPMPLQAANHKPANRGVAELAKQQGLEYYGFGRYGKKGKVSHISIDGKLVRKNPMSITPSPVGAPQSQSQSMHESKEESHGSIKKSLKFILAEASALSSTRTRSHVNEDGSDLQVTGNTVRVGLDGRSEFDLPGTSFSYTQEESKQEEKEVQEERMGLLEAQDEGSPILGSTPGEAIDIVDGGKSTSGPKIWKTGILRKRKDNGKV